MLQWSLFEIELALAIVIGGRPHMDTSLLEKLLVVRERGLVLRIGELSLVGPLLRQVLARPATWTVVIQTMVF